jgi:hypothetical protein
MCALRQHATAQRGSALCTCDASTVCRIRIESRSLLRYSGNDAVQKPDKFEIKADIPGERANLCKIVLLCYPRHMHAKQAVSEGK